MGLQKRVGMRFTGGAWRGEVSPYGTPLRLRPGRLAGRLRDTGVKPVKMSLHQLPLGAELIYGNGHGWEISLL